MDLARFFKSYMAEDFIARVSFCFVSQEFLLLPRTYNVRKMSLKNSVLWAEISTLSLFTENRTKIKDI